jgi:hypothetical protein
MSFFVIQPGQTLTDLGKVFPDFKDFRIVASAGLLAQERFSSTPTMIIKGVFQFSRSDKRQMARSIEKFVNYNGGKVMLRRDQHISQTKKPISGFTHQAQHVIDTIFSEAEENPEYVYVLQLPIDRFKNDRAMEVRFVNHSDGSVTITNEIWGKGFDLSQGRRGMITPHQSSSFHFDNKDLLDASMVTPINRARDLECSAWCVTPEQYQETVKDRKAFIRSSFGLRNEKSNKKLEAIIHNPQACILGEALEGYVPLQFQELKRTLSSVFRIAAHAKEVGVRSEVFSVGLVKINSTWMPLDIYHVSPFYKDLAANLSPDKSKINPSQKARFL